MLLLNMNTKIIHGKSNVSFTFDLGWPWKTKVNSLSFRRSYLEHVIGMVEGWSVKRFAFRWEIHNISSIRLKSTYFSFWLKLQYRCWCTRLYIIITPFLCVASGHSENTNCREHFALCGHIHYTKKLRIIWKILDVLCSFMNWASL